MHWRKTTIIIVTIALAVTPSVALARTTKRLKAVSYGAPVELQIPRLGVKAKVEKTSIDRRGILEAPKRPEDVGWYRNGTIPGKRGNAVIGGHLNWNNSLGAFRRLTRVRPGDLVKVKNDFGKTLHFRVTEVTSYHNGKTPIQRIAGPSKGFHLNLYTCDGVFDRNKRDYSRRVVVYTELVR